MRAIGFKHRPHKSSISPYIPDFFADSIVDVDFGKLHQLGVRHIFLDLDQTLRRAYSSSLEAEVIDFFAELHNHGWFKTISLITNNNRNLKRYSEPLKARIFQPYWRNAQMIRKPSPEFYQKALQQLDAKANQTVMIGDKVRFDIAGANQVGIYTILINPRGRDYWFDLLLLSRFRDRRSLKTALRAHQSIDPSVHFD